VVFDVAKPRPKPSGFPPDASYFTHGASVSDKGYVWRAMGTSEFDKLVRGELTYKGGAPKRTGWFAPTPESAAQYSGKGRYLVEFGGGLRSSEEGLVGSATRDKVSRIWKFENGKWIEVPLHEVFR
jgi:hypothetical protein